MGMGRGGRLASILCRLLLEDTDCHLRSGRKRRRREMLKHGFILKSFISKVEFESAPNAESQQPIFGCPRISQLIAREVSGEKR